MTTIKKRKLSSTTQLPSPLMKRLFTLLLPARRHSRAFLLSLVALVVVPGAFGQTARRLDDLEDTASKHAKQITTNTANIKNVDTGLKLLAIRVDGLDQQIAQILDSLKKAAGAGEATAPKSDLDGLRGKIDNLQETTNRLSKQLGMATGAQVSELQSQMEKVQEGVNGVQTRLKELLEKKPAEVMSVPVTVPQPVLTVVDQEARRGINMVWTLVAGFLVMFMQAGFALVETGFTRSKNAVHTMSMNFMIYSLAMIAYWAIGFGLQAGGIGAAHSCATPPDFGSSWDKLNMELGIPLGDGKWMGLLGWAGFGLPQGMMQNNIPAATAGHMQMDGGIFTLFLFSMVFMATAAIIPTGAMAERWRFKAFCWYGLGVGAFIYPVYANWVWGGGWLAAMGVNWHLGHGHVDFAGSSVVHLCGGTIAFVGARMLKARRGKGEPGVSFRPHNIPMGMLGTFILALGWFGFNAGSTLSGVGHDTPMGIVATNTMLASAAGAIVGMLMSWRKFDHPDPTFMCNGMLAGFVAVTGPCAFIDSWAAIVIGGGAGWLMFWAARHIEEKLNIDDPVGAIAVHGVCGAWGILSVGLFANGKFGEHWNQREGYVTGLLYGDAGQFLAEIVGGLACVGFVYGSAKLLFWVIGTFCPHRPTLREEEEGLDKSEFNRTAY